jgi:hypothetical protein
MVEEEKRARQVGGVRLFAEEDADLDRYAADPERWASFHDDEPLAFDPTRHPRPSPPEQARLFDLGDDASPVQ